MSIRHGRFSMDDRIYINKKPASSEKLSNIASFQRKLLGTRYRLRATTPEKYMRLCRKGKLVHTK